MPRIVRGALLQATWTGDKESMIQKHEKYAHEAAKQGAQVMLFQELFYGPYFCQVQDPQYYSYTELIPDGPTTVRSLMRPSRWTLNWRTTRPRWIIAACGMNQFDLTWAMNRRSHGPNSTPFESNWMSGPLSIWPPF